MLRKHCSLHIDIIILNRTRNGDNFPLNSEMKIEEMQIQRKFVGAKKLCSKASLEKLNLIVRGVDCGTYLRGSVHESLLLYVTYPRGSVVLVYSRLISMGCIAKFPSFYEGIFQRKCESIMDFRRKLFRGLELQNNAKNVKQYKFKSH